MERLLGWLERHCRLLWNEERLLLLGERIIRVETSRLRLDKWLLSIDIGHTSHLGRHHRLSLNEGIELRLLLEVVIGRTEYHSKSVKAFTLGMNHQAVPLRLGIEHVRLLLLDGREEVHYFRFSRRRLDFRCTRTRSASRGCLLRGSSWTRNERRRLIVRADYPPLAALSEDFPFALL